MLGEAVNEEKGKTTESFELECLVDVHVEAHIPEYYIESLNQRLDIYRRISDIRTSEDASDVLDELIDRFGDPPYSVKGLIDVALIRNTAASLGIYEIKQQNNALNLYQHKINMQQVSALLRTCRYKIMVNAGAKPYLSIKISEKANPLTILREVLDAASLEQTKNRRFDRQNN